MKEDRFEIRFSGAGGQGIITAAIIFAEAAAIHESNYVCQTQSYGPEARGGKSKAVLYSMRVNNPRPDVEIKAIDFRIGLGDREQPTSRARPALLAITLGETVD